MNSTKPADDDVLHQDKSGHRSIVVHPSVFEGIKSIQKLQKGSPRFDLGDLATAALSLVLEMPNTAQVLYERACSDFKKRL